MLLIFYARLFRVCGTQIVKEVLVFCLVLMAWCKSSRGGIVGEEEKYGSTPFQTKKMEICADQPDQVPYPSATAQIADVKRVPLGNGNVHSRGSEEIQVSGSAWSRILPASSPRSCITTSFSTNMLDFSNNSGRRPENSSEVRETSDRWISRSY